MPLPIEHASPTPSSYILSPYVFGGTFPSYRLSSTTDRRSYTIIAQSPDGVRPSQPNRKDLHRLLDQLPPMSQQHSTGTNERNEQYRGGYAAIVPFALFSSEVGE